MSRITKTVPNIIFLSVCDCDRTFHLEESSVSHGDIISKKTAGRYGGVHPIGAFVNSGILWAWFCSPCVKPSAQMDRLSPGDRRWCPVTSSCGCSGAPLGPIAGVAKSSEERPLVLPPDGS